MKANTLTVRGELLRDLRNTCDLGNELATLLSVSAQLSDLTLAAAVALVIERLRGELTKCEFAAAAMRDEAAAAEAGHKSAP